MIEGSCLCGGIRYEAEQPAGPMAHCHCRICRKAHGAAFATILPVTQGGFRWLDGEELLRSYESSPGKLRWFCSGCGSQIISTRTEDTEKLLLRAGCIDRGYPGSAVAHGWVDSSAPWYAIDDDLPCFPRSLPGSPRGAEE